MPHNMSHPSGKAKSGLCRHIICLGDCGGPLGGEQHQHNTGLKEYPRNRMMEKHLFIDVGHGTAASDVMSSFDSQL